MIKILNSNFERQAVIRKVIDCKRFEEINGQNTITFDAVFDKKASLYIDENSIIEIDNDYFDMAYLVKQQNEDGTLTLRAECEHISYRLNDPEYNTYTFVYYGTPTEILAQILQDTPFTVGTVEFTEITSYAAQEAKSRRRMLMEFASQIGGEVLFDKFTISIVGHRGDTSRKLLAKGKNIKIVSKTVNKREKDSSGNPLISYTCTPAQTANTPLCLGDEVLLVQKELGIQEQLRIVRYAYNPYDNDEAEIELANFISGLEDQIYNIQINTVAKGKIYNGCSIGPDEGFVCVRSDGKVKSILNATDGIRIKTDRGSGLEDAVYVGTDGRIRVNTIDEELSEVDQRLTKNEADIQVNADEIQLRVTQETYNTGVNGINQRISEAEASIEVTAEAVATKADKSVTDGLETRMSSAEQIITADSIVSTVRSSSQYTNDLAGKANTGVTDALNTRMTNAESSISQNAYNINLKVSKGDVVNQINLDSSGATISAQKINLQGAVTVSAFSQDAANLINSKTDSAQVTTITNTTIATTNVVAQFLKVLAANIEGTISASKVLAGYIQGRLETDGITLRGSNGVIPNIIWANGVEIYSPDSNSIHLNKNFAGGYADLRCGTVNGYDLNDFLRKNGNVGFYGSTPIARQSITSLPSDASLSDVITKLNGLMTRLGQYYYGLFYVS